MPFRHELIDEVLKNYHCPEDLMGEGGIFNQLIKALIERCLIAELEALPDLVCYKPPDEPKMPCMQGFQ